MGVRELGSESTASLPLSTMARRSLNRVLLSACSKAPIRARWP